MHFLKRKVLVSLTAFLYFLTHLSITFASSFQTTDKKHISYTETGHGTPLVLIHAFPTDQRLWKPQQDALKAYFRVITLDLWGFGVSSPTDGNAISMEKYADQVYQVLQHLHVEKAIIGGESMGGYITLAFLEKYPQKVAGLILSDTQSIADNAEAKAKREITALELLQHGTTNFINGFMPKALSANASEQTKAFLRHVLENQKATAMASALRGMALRHDTSQVLAKSAVPTLIITGEQDTLIDPQQSKNMHDLAKNSKLIIINNAGHLSNLEQPEQWNAAVINMFHKK